MKVINKVIINNVDDINPEDDFEDIISKLKANKKNVWESLRGNGDFRNDECIELLKQADVVVTNPPFSLFREFMHQLVKYKRKFIVIGSMTAITYKKIFPLLKKNKIWLGIGFRTGNACFSTPDSDELKKFGNIRWYTNVDHGHYPEPLSLMTMEDNLKYSKHKEIIENGYEKYVNYDGIDVPYTDAIPSDYNGDMGVPISFMDKYNPDQFEIIKYNRGDDGKYLCLKDGSIPFSRILIRHKKK